ncbi:MAG: SDR family oxidoreductase [Chloroflexi bacterium]|nr:SDR family oxidoreductase [Chloroflexota bacterium]
MDLGLKGKTAIVTGGASNIGRAITLTLAGEGANVCIADLDEKQAHRTARDAEALGVRSLLVRIDVADRASVESMVSRTLEAFGQIDILVNNVGWSIPDVLLVDKPDDQIEKETRINYWGVIYASRAVTPHMIGRKYGKIINIASDAGRLGVPGSAVFSGVKGAVISLTRAHAREAGRYGINVNAICPGWVVPAKPEDAGEGSFWRDRVKDVWNSDDLKKRMAAAVIRRLGDPQDIADMVAFLSSDKASYITGQAISVDGGMAMI